MSTTPVTYPSWLGIPTATLAQGIPFLQGAAGAFPQTSNQNTTTNSNSNTQSVLNTLANLNANSQTASTGTSGYGTQGQLAIQSILPTLQRLTGNSVNLQPYQAQQTQQINTGANAQQKSVDAIMAARGLASSPVAATADTGIQNQRIAQTTNLDQSIPVLQQQLQTQNLGAANSVLSNLPRTQTQNQTGSSNQSQNTNQTGDTTQTSQATQKVNAASGGGIGGFLGGLGSALGSIFGI